MFALAPLLLQAVLMITTASTSESSESGGPHPRLRSTRVHHGVWSARPLWTPSCYNGIFPDTNQDPTRTFCCSVNSEVCSEKYSPPAIPVSSLPSYTKDPRRDHHHVVDGPVVGNGNLGIAIGSGNIFNVSHNWIGRGNLIEEYTWLLCLYRTAASTSCTASPTNLASLTAMPFYFCAPTVHTPF